MKPDTNIDEHLKGFKDPAQIKDYHGLIKDEATNQLTDKDVDLISEVLENEANQSPDIKLLREIQEGKIPEELLEDEVESNSGFANINPITGQFMNVDTIDSDEDNMGKSLDSYLEELDKIDAEHVELSESSITKTLETNYGQELSLDDLKKVQSAIEKFKNDDKITYNDMPDPIKKEIAKTITSMTDQSGSAVYVGNKELRNQMAREFIGTVIQESYAEEFSKTMIDLQKDIDRISKNEISKIYSNATIRQRDIMENKTIEIAKEIESKEPEKAKLLREISYSFKQSYLLEDMYKTCRDTGKLRVKYIEMEKPSKVYKDFNMKYEKSKYAIKNFEMLEPILDRHLPDYIDMKYIRKFLIIFCKYCKNMNPNKIQDHVFMYYFITNITSLDLFDKNNSQDKEFYDKIIDNIIRFIELIKLKENK